jgi:AraC-like DNA-binding protein
MHYHEVEPHPWLRPFVRCFWGLRIEDAPPQLQRVLPDGCCELVIHCGHRFTQQIDSHTETQPRRLFVGPTARAVLIAPGRSVDAIAIRFTPGGAALLVRHPLSELRDRIADIDDIGVRFDNDIIDVLAPLPDNERIGVLERALLRRVQSVTVDRSVWHTQRMIMRQSGRVRIDDVARATGLSLRQLQRRFQQQVGLGPKQLARVARLQRALALANAKATTYSQIAIEAGYADQSHFTREFSDIAGVSPTRYFAEVHALNDVFAASARSGGGD